MKKLSARIVLVEDDKITVKTLKTMLQRWGCQVQASFDEGEPAIECIQQHQVDLVLMDININGKLDGIETATRIKADYGLPIVFITGDAGEDIYERARLVEPHGFITKPIDYRNMVAVLDIALRKHDLEQNYLRAQQQLKSALRGGRMGAWNIDLQTQAINFSGPWEYITGYSQKQLSQNFKHWSNLIHPADLPHLAHAFQDKLKKVSDVISVEFRFKHNDGGYIWLSLKGMLDTCDRNQQPWQASGVVQDISELRKYLGRLAEDERRYRTLFESSYNSVLLLKDGQVVDCNQRTAELFNTTRDKILGLTIDEMSPQIQPGGANSATKIQEYLKAALGGTPQHFTWSHITRTGKSIFTETSLNRVDIAGEMYVLVVVIDITDQKRLTEALKSSEKTARALLDAGKDSIVLIDEAGIVYDANEEAARGLRVSLDQMRGSNVYKLISKDLVSLRRLQVTRAFSTGREQYLEDYHKGVWYASSVYPIIDDNGKVERVAAYVRDISILKKAEDELRLRSELYSSFFYSNRSVMLMIDPETGDIRDANDAATAFYGYTQDYLKKLNINDLKNKQRPGVEPYKRSSDLISRFFEQHKLANGQTRDVEVYMGIVEVEGEKRLYEIIHDITEQRKTEQMLFESRQRYKELVENMSDGLCATDAQDNITYANQRLCQMLKCTMDDLKGKYPQEFLLNHQQGLFMPGTAITKGITYKTYEAEIIASNGVVIPVSVSPHPLFDEIGRYNGALAVITDITDRRKVVQYKIQAEKIAERSLRLASLGTLAGGLAHEINQPLTVMKFEVESLLLRNKKSIPIKIEEFIDGLQTTNQQIDRINNIINHLRSLIRDTRSRSLVECDLNKVLDRALYMVREQLKSHGIELITRWHSEVPAVMSNPLLIEQIAINITVNAMQALDDVMQPRKYIQISTKQIGGSTRISFYNNGPQIPADVLPTIFDPFITTKASEPGQGMGIGLSIVENFVHSLNGSIEVENVKEGGVRFTVHLPNQVVN